MNYSVENESVGNGFGNMFGGGSWGLIILLFLFFAIFCGGGLFNRGERDNREEPRNWQVDRDVLEGRYANANATAASTAEIIANQNAIDQRRADRELVRAENQIAQMQTMAAIREASRTDHIGEDLGFIKSNMAIKAPAYATAYLPAGVRYPTRGLEEGYM